MNPVVLLDEVDKVGADWRGDPSAAPSRCSTLRRSTPSATTTWTSSSTSPRSCSSRPRTSPRPSGTAPRSDGGDPVRRLHGRREGRHRASYLWPRQRDRAGLREDEVSIGDDVFELIVSQYTREAGVRQLERELGSRSAKWRRRSRPARPSAARRQTRRSQGTRPTALLPGVGRADRRARRVDRPRGYRNRR